MPAPWVLVVDDEAGMVETLGDILAANGYRVAIARSGGAAIVMALTTRYDAVLMDIRMPGMNGVEALHVIKNTVPQTAVIMMTAFSQHELVEKAKQERALAVLPKPLDIELVLGLLDRVTRRNGRSQAGVP